MTLNLRAGVESLSEATKWLLERVGHDARSAAAGAMPYLRMLGVVASGYYLARSALAAQQRVVADVDPQFHAATLATSRFYAEQLLP